MSTDSQLPQDPALGRRVTRRAFVQLAAAGSAGAMVAGCTRDSDAAAGGVLPYVKDPTDFIVHPTNLETRLELVQGLITPNDLFFVRNHAPTPRIDQDTYRLVVEGDTLSGPVEFTYEDLLRLPARSTVAYLECAGNWRSLSQQIHGRAARGGQWGRGAVGCAEWTGTPLRSVLEAAGLQTGAAHVNLYGMDDGEFNRPMPLAKAMDDDTLLVYAMNGAVLPPDHGFPIRAVVPGWAGSNSVKWLGRVQVSVEPFWVKNTTTSYVLVGEPWPSEQYSPADGAPITVLNIKSTLALPSPATLAAGELAVRGFAYSPHGKIARVDWIADGGTVGGQARILDPVLPLAWARFEFVWNALPGAHTITVRATDERGNTQPNEMPYNEKGYLLNTPVPHRIEVV